MKNVLGKKKRHVKSDFIFTGIFILMACFVTLHAAVVIHIDPIFKGKFKANQFMDLSGKLMDHISKKPLDLRLTDHQVLGIFWGFQKYLVALYVLFLLFLIASRGANKGEYEGVEHGSAEFAENDELKSLRDKNGWYVLGDKLYLNPKSKDEEISELNQHQFVVGKPKCGKSWRKIIADLIRGKCNYVVVDIKGHIYRLTCFLLKLRGYKIKVLNLIEPKYSMRFNSFQYVRSDTDINIQAETFLRNTEGETAEVKKDFWYKAESSLLLALMFYIYKELPQAEWSYPNVLKLLLSSININSGMDDEEIRISHEITVLDTIFGELEKKNPEHVALAAWKTFKLNAQSPETAAGVMEGLAVRFNIFYTEEIKNLSMDDEIEIDKLNDEKTVVFVMIPDTHRTYDVISALFFSTLFQRLIYIADFVEEGELKIHCQCLMDEFVNCGVIPDFDTLLTTMRSRDICSTMIVQDINQLEKKYPKNWHSIIGCCDTIIYMGTQEQKTREYISKLLGVTTTETVNPGYSYKRNGGGRNENVSAHKRELMTPDELRTIPNKMQIVFIGSLNPIYVKKYRTEKTQEYKYLKKKYYSNYRDVRREDEDLKATLNKICQEYEEFVANVMI